MPKSKEQKQEILKELVENIDNQTAITFVDFKGINVKDVSELRKELKENGAKMVVAKKTLIQKALSEKGIEADIRNMEGQIALVFAFEDPVIAVKTIDMFAKKHEHIQIIGGYFEQQMQAREHMLVIASLPSREELLARTVGSIAAPMSGFLQVIHGNIKGLVVALSAIADKKQ